MSHKPAKPIQEQIADIIARRRSRLELEIEEFQHKIYGEEEYWGLGGGNAPRYEKCIEIRENELEQLNALANGYSGPIKTTTIKRRYRYRCASCGKYFETFTSLYGDHIDCPYCRHDVSKETESVIEHEVIVPPMPHYYDNFSEWRRMFE